VNLWGSRRPYLIHIKTNGLALRTDLLRRLKDVEASTASKIDYGLTLNSLGQRIDY
jgi:hypothetical protein